MKFFSYLGAALFLIVTIINPGIARAQNEGDEFLAEGSEENGESLRGHEHLRGSSGRHRDGEIQTLHALQ